MTAVRFEAGTHVRNIGKNLDHTLVEAVDTTGRHEGLTTTFVTHHSGVTFVRQDGAIEEQQGDGVGVGQAARTAKARRALYHNTRNHTWALGLQTAHRLSIGGSLIVRGKRWRRARKQKGCE